MIPETTQHWILAEKPTGKPVLLGDNTTFQLVAKPTPRLEQDGHVLLKVLYIHNDPAQRAWIDARITPDRLYVDPVEVGDTMRSYSSIAQVIESRSDKLPVGTIVSYASGWCEYVVAPATDCQRLDAVAGLQPVHLVAMFGLAGISAYYGLVDIGKVGPNDAIVISGAAGAVGSMAVQLAKHVLGCKKVIGIAGTDQKCRWVESLGADVCVNYKSPTFKEEVARATEGFVEVFFDNVGGEILNHMLTRVALHGRVIACGAIAEYNGAETAGITNWYHVIAMRMRVLGFVVLDAPQARLGEITQHLFDAYGQGKLKATDEGVTIVPTEFEDVPKTWTRLFDGLNTGKLFSKIA